MKWVNRVSGNSSLIQEDNGDSIFHCKDNKTRLIKKKIHARKKLSLAFLLSFTILFPCFCNVYYYAGLISVAGSIGWFPKAQSSA